VVRRGAALGFTPDRPSGRRSTSTEVKYSPIEARCLPSGRADFGACRPALSCRVRQSGAVLTEGRPRLPGTLAVSKHRQRGAGSRNTSPPTMVSSGRGKLGHEVADQGHLLAVTLVGGNPLDLLPERRLTPRRRAAAPGNAGCRTASERSPGSDDFEHRGRGIIKADVKRPRHAIGTVVRMVPPAPVVEWSGAAARRVSVPLLVDGHEILPMSVARQLHGATQR